MKVVEESRTESTPHEKVSPFFSSSPSVASPYPAISNFLSSRHTIRSKTTALHMQLDPTSIAKGAAISDTTSYLLPPIPSGRRYTDTPLRSM